MGQKPQGLRNIPRRDFRVSEILLSEYSCCWDPVKASKKQDSHFNANSAWLYKRAEVKVWSQNKDPLTRDIFMNSSSCQSLLNHSLCLFSHACWLPLLIPTFLWYLQCFMIIVLLICLGGTEEMGSAVRMSLCLNSAYRNDQRQQPLKNVHYNDSSHLAALNLYLYFLYFQIET